MGSRRHPEPFPPVNDILLTLSISKSWGSTNTSLTVPLRIGSTNAVVPAPTLSSTVILGGFITS